MLGLMYVLFIIPVMYNNIILLLSIWYRGINVFQVGL